MSHLPPTTIGATEDTGPIRDAFNQSEPPVQMPAMGRNNVAMAEPNVGLSLGSNTGAAPRQPNQRMRGRIHANNDVLNGISGMEHLSNSLNTRKPTGQSPAIMA